MTQLSNFLEIITTNQGQALLAIGLYVILFTVFTIGFDGDRFEELEDFCEAFHKNEQSKNKLQKRVIKHFKASNTYRNACTVTYAFSGMLFGLSKVIPMRSHGLFHKLTAIQETLITWVIMTLLVFILMHALHYIVTIVNFHRVTKRGLHLN